MTTLEHYNKVNAFLDEHGEPKDCAISDCQTCEEIEKSRMALNGSEYRKPKKITQPDRRKKRYIVIDERGKDRMFYRLDKVCSHIRATQKDVYKIMNTGESHNGFTVDVEDLKSE